MSGEKFFYGRSPPLSIPFKFFASAPPFGLAACLVLLWAGPDAFASRWTPALLAVTHLTTIGFLAMVMIGALVQVLAVVAGAQLPGGKTTAALIHAALAAGAVLMAGGFVARQPWLLQAGAAALAAGFGAVVAVSFWSLRGARSAGPVVTAIRMALAALLVAATLGTVLAVALARGWTLAFEALTNLHLQWGLIGWVLLLVAGVATQVVPMFQSTPEYSARAMRAFYWIAFLALIAVTVLTLFAATPGWSVAVKTVVAASVAAFAAYTLALQSKRRRRAPDATLRFWRTGMWSLLAASAVWLSAQFRPALGQWQGYDLLLGTLAIFGFAISVVNGMLCRIAPFLAWLHMQEAAGGAAVPPTLRKILPDHWCMWQWRVHCAALVLLLAAVPWPAAFLRAATLCAAASFLLLWRNLLHTLRVCRAFRTGMTGNSARTSFFRKFG
ncbi:MAG TPA: permease [Burkholderiales bacterium]|nr:permease [Burkholderiales bacterium]